MSDSLITGKQADLFSATGSVYVKGPDLLTDARAIIDAAQASAYRAVNVALVYRNWLLGRRIAEEDLGGAARAEYGSRVVTSLAEQLTGIYGDGFDRRSLYMFLQFYRRFPIVDSLSPQSGGLLSWTHYRKLLQVESDEALKWYINEAAGEGWGVRTLQRNISSQYYERTLLSQNKEAVKNEMVRVTAPLQDKLEFIKNPVVAEFLGLSQRTDFTESDLETCILDNLGKFLMELGKGYAFVARQQHIQTEKADYFIDLRYVAENQGKGRLAIDNTAKECRIPMTETGELICEFAPTNIYDDNPYSKCFSFIICKIQFAQSKFASLRMF